MRASGMSNKVGHCQCSHYSNIKEKWTARGNTKLEQRRKQHAKRPASENGEHSSEPFSALHMK